MNFFKKLSKLKLLWGVCALVFAGALLSCVVDDKDDDDNKTEQPSSGTELSGVSISGAMTIEADKSSTLTATPTFKNDSGDSSSVSYKWKITGGSGYATLSESTENTVTITGKNATTSEQTVTVKVTATYNGESFSATHSVKIAAEGVTIKDELTELKITPAATSVSATGTVDLTATASYTGNPSITFSWEITEGREYASLESENGRAAQTITKTNTLTGKNTTDTAQIVTVKVTASDGTNTKTATYSITVTGTGSVAGGESGGSGSGSGGSESGGTSGTTPAPEGNVIKASDIPLGFAGVNSGFASIGVTSYSKGSYSNPVTTRADLVKAVSAGGIIYISGMIDMSDEGTGSKLPVVGAKNTDVSSVMDSWISSKTSGKYTTYKDWISAYSGAVGKSTDDKKLGNSGNSALASTLWTLNNAWKSVIQLNIKSNTILIGLGSNSGIRGGTISINGVSNVAIRNLYLVDAIDMFPHHEKDDGYNSQFDCITVQGTGVKNIWIDHCTFEDTMVMQHVTNGLDSSDEKWQNYDGSCDIKGDAAGVTVSNCHFFKHDKTMLIGSDDKEGNNTVRKISLINNYFDSCVQRLPMVRNSQIHILNNYYEFDKQYTVGDGKTKMSYGIGVRNGSLVYSEANYFGSNMNYPYDGDSKTKSTSKIYIKGDVAAKSGSGNYTVLSSAPFTPSYSYSAKTADDAKAYVLENAGYGKWTVQQ